MLAALDPWEAVLLGLVEGVTEFLPVSSTGHLLLAQRALGLERSGALDAFVVVVQLGAILAVLGLYRARVGQMVRGLLGRDAAGARLARRVLLAFVPAGVLGLLLEGPVERHLFGLWPVTAAWAVGGVLLLLVGRRVGPQARVASGGSGAAGDELEALSVRGALLIGAFQCVALVPGTSRSLVSLLGGIVAGLSLAAAVEFSFLLGGLTLAAAAGWKILTQGPALLEGLGSNALVLGSVAAALAAAASVAFLAAWVRRHGLGLFGWYRLALAALVAGLLLSGRLPSG
jgi:undecaprenyl-diphosphatase